MSGNEREDLLLLQPVKEKAGREKKEREKERERERDGRKKIFKVLWTRTSLENET